jgi:hypothetical protein
MDRLDIQYLDPNALEPDAANPRKITKRAGERLRAGLEHFGLVEPLVYNTRTDSLISGHQRRTQAIELGITEVPVVMVDLDETEAKALSLLLNNAKAQGSWDTELLTARLEELHAVDALELAAFDVSDLEPASAGDEVSFTAKGHGWELLDHRIKCPKPKSAGCEVCDDIRALLEGLAGDEEQ